MPIIDIQNITAGYGRKPILHGISLAVNKGEIVAIIGANGAGKSTVLKTVVGLLALQKGDISFEEDIINGSSPEENVRRGISYVPQGNIVFDDLTVAENLRVGGYSIDDKSILSSRLAEVFELFPELSDRKRTDAGNLSGGEKQMLALGRALMLKPKLLLLDEPSLGLSPKAVLKCFSTIKSIQKKFKTSVLIVEQNIEGVFSIAERVHVLALGKVAAEDTPTNLPKERLKSLFLGV